MIKYNPHQNLDKLIEEVIKTFEPQSSDDPSQFSVSLGTMNILMQVVGLDWDDLKTCFLNRYVLGYAFGFSFGVVSECGIEGDYNKITLVNKIYNNLFGYLFNDGNPNPITLRNCYKIEDGVRVDLHDGKIELNESYVICQDLHLQGDELFHEGNDRGAKDAENLFLESKDPLSLKRYLHDNHRLELGALKGISVKSDNSTQFFVEAMRQDGQVVEQGHYGGFNWFQKAAEQGYAIVLFYLGAMYEKGIGFTQDHKKAAKWWRLSAEQGDAMAQNNLGWMYDIGRGVTQDDREAVKWFRLSAEQGYAQAQSNLGVAYAKGRGVTLDHKEAVKWFIIAGANVEEKSRKNREKIEKQMTLAQIAEAQKLAREWMEEPGNAKK